MSWNGTVNCRWCGGRGHNKRTCPHFTETLKQRALDEINNGEGYDGYWGRQYNKRVRKTGLYADGTPMSAEAKATTKQTRRCKYCNKKGHNRRTCPELKKDIAKAAQECQTYRINLLEKMQDMGLGIGALVATERYGELHGYMVKQVAWDQINHFNGAHGSPIHAEILRKEGVSRWQQTQSFGLPAVGDEDQPYRYQVMGPVPAAGIVPPANWMDLSICEDWAKAEYKERQSPNFYDNYEY